MAPNVPDHYALQEAAKIATRSSGCDITPLIMNEKLKELDLQYRHGENWLPTEKGKPICERHAWAVKNKSGYNLKWNWQGVDDLINSTKKNS